MKHTRLFQFLLWLTLGFAAVLLGFALFSPGARLPVNTAARALQITGFYTLNGQAEQHPFQGQVSAELDCNEQLTVQGHLNQAVKPNEQMVMRIANLRVTVLVNGRAVFTFGRQHPGFLRTAGNVWTSFTSEGVQPEDTVTFQLEKVYGNATLSSYHDFFANLYAGSEYPVYRSAIVSQGPTLFVGITILVLGLVMLFISLYSHALKITRASDYIYLAAFVLASGFWTSIQYDYISLLVPYPAFNQTLEMISMALSPVFLTRYMLSLLTPRCKRMGFVALYASLAIAATGIVLQLWGIVDLPAFTVAFVAVDIPVVAVFSGCLLATLKKPAGEEPRAAVWPLFVLFLGALLNMANYLFTWRTGGLFYALSLLAFAVLEVFRLFTILRENIRRNNEYMKLENELTQSRIAVMLSQIKPHFLFNALNSISALCLTDPIMADQAITSLSNYLRGNIRSLEQSAPVPFEQELNHIKYYVRLEQLRYGDKLRVVYAIDTTDFEVPTLSLQTLVENAIRHGVSPKPEGGLVVVHTQREENATLVRILDNGVGFDPDMRSQNADSIGLANAKKRMEVMMGATFDIQSIPGTGTTITIRIPDGSRKGKHEHHLRG